MLKYKLIYVFATLCGIAFAQHDYPGGAPPTSATVPELFGAGLISTNYRERDITISPDRTQIYYSLQYSLTRSVILYVEYKDGKWSRPKRASFSSLENADIEPAFTPNGNRLFFASGRSGSFDIYYVDKQGDGSWSAPVSAGGAVNTGSNEFYPSISSNGTLYYTAPYNGTEDIWFSRLTDGVYGTPEVLPAPVNTNGGEFNAFISPDGSKIYFGSESSGGGDIYRSSKSGSTWSTPTRLLLNSGRLDYCPYESPDGFFFFTSERTPSAVVSPNPFEVERIIRAQNMPRSNGGDIYWAK